jgi:hypothetical protein
VAVQAQSAWLDPATVSRGIAGIIDVAIEPTVAFCEYVFDRYGRFPAYLPSFSTVVGFQVAHLDTHFYDRHYRPEVLTSAHRRHFDPSCTGRHVSKMVSMSRVGDFFTEWKRRLNARDAVAIAVHYEATRIARRRSLPHDPTVLPIDGF